MIYSNQAVFLFYVCRDPERCFSITGYERLHLFTIYTAFIEGDKSPIIVIWLAN